MRPQTLTLALALSLAIAAAPPLLPPPLDGFGAAWADDDDDDDDDGGGGGRGRDDDDDDDDDRPRRGAGRGDDGSEPRRRAAAPAAAVVAPVRPRTAAPPAAFARGEIVVVDLSDDDLSELLGRGYEVILSEPVPGLGGIARRLRAPAGLTEAEARDEVRALASGGGADFNHFYRVEEGGPEPSALPPCTGMHCPSLQLIAWPAPPARVAGCGGSVPIGVIDTGINTGHETFAGGRLEVLRLADAELDPSRAIHGTAVAALLIGSPESRSPGLLPMAEVIAVDAFHVAGGDERADAFTLIRALDALAGRGARVINLSLAGPPNAALEEAVARMLAQGVVLVAAVGNAGPRAEPAFPAAYEGVIAVTAIDSRLGIYRRAVQGDHVDLAAPGVEVWTAASISGARPKTGTSFAAPFVTAAAALLLEAEPGLAPAEVADRLRAAARDLGEPGQDPVFGAGLVQAAGLCAERL